MQHFIESDSQVLPGDPGSLFDPDSSSDRTSRTAAEASTSLDEREIWLCELAGLLVEQGDATTLFARALRLGGRLVPAVRRWGVYAVAPGNEAIMLVDLQDDQMRQPGAVTPSRDTGMLGFGTAVDRQVIVERTMALLRLPESAAVEQATPPVSMGRAKATAACFPLIAVDGALVGVLAVTTRPGASLSTTDLALLRTVSQHLTVLLARHVRRGAATGPATALAAQPSARDEREEFISLAAHELRSPLTSVKGYAQLLLRGARKDPVYPENNLRALLAIEQQASRMSDMVAEMLDASRIMRGAFELHRRPTDMYALVHRVVEQRRPSLDRHTLRLETDEAGLVGQWDTQRVEQIIRDLVDNAIRFSPNGGTVNLRLTREGTIARLDVDDEGIGVDSEERERIFEPFYRGQEAQRRNLSGLGLGLFVSRTIAEQLGGRLWLQPSDSTRQGSAFCLELPMAA